MRYLLIPMFLAGCESMEPAGNPFDPVAGEAASSDAGFEPDPTFDFEEFEISSEELHAAAGDPDEVEDAPPEPAAEPEPEAAPPPAASPQAAPVQVISEAPVRSTGATAWPLRLVYAIPDAQPPRAILGLPDGEEIVVKPGTMVPDQGIVVIAIGSHQVELARVTARGDHATVASQTITSQY